MNRAVCVPRPRVRCAPLPAPVVIHLVRARGLAAPREAVLAHLLTFLIRARQRLLELDDCLAPLWHLQHDHAGERRRRTGGAQVLLGWTISAVVSDCDTNSKIRARQCTRNRHAQPVVSAAKGDAHFRSMRKCSLDFYPTTTASTPYRLCGTVYRITL